MDLETLSLSGRQFTALRDYLLPPNPESEEAAFAFAQYCAQDRTFRVKEIHNLRPDEFASRSLYFLELADAARARIIKHAHDLSCSLIEIHSHPLQETARFSESDVLGFVEFVPHVLWRLHGRPYGAIVLTSNSYDGFAWQKKGCQPAPLAFEIDGIIQQKPTRASLETWRDYHG